VVSIILTTFNGEKYLQQQLSSIAAQTYKDIELIICDDGSTDGTQEIIRNFTKEHPCASYYFNSTNLGVNKNFEQGVCRASGEYIAIADQDDIWLPQKIEEQIKLFTTDDVLLVHSASIRFSNDDFPKKKVSSATMFAGSDVLKLALRNSVSGHNMIFRKSLLNTTLPFPQDTYYDWWLVQNAAATGVVTSSNKVHVYHRAHDSNVTVRARTTKNQTEEEYEERKAALRNFLRIKELRQEDKNLLGALQKKFLLLENSNYSQELFNFYMKYRKRLFFYKKGLFAYFSQKKTAKRMSFREA
jgi:glycosyltransferase involved in cell wall biosynthesis